MKITSKGRVTVPRYIRERLGFLPDTELEWEIRGGAAVRKKIGSGEQHRGRAIIEYMRGRSTVRISTDEIMELTRGDV